MTAMPIIAAGTKIHSLYDGQYLVTVCEDIYPGDSMMARKFSDWQIDVPKKGEPIPDDLMQSLIALAAAYSVTTGRNLLRMDTGEPLFGQFKANIRASI